MFSKRINEATPLIKKIEKGKAPVLNEVKVTLDHTTTEILLTKLIENMDMAIDIRDFQSLKCVNKQFNEIAGQYKVEFSVIENKQKIKKIAENTTEIVNVLKTYQQKEKTVDQLRKVAERNQQHDGKVLCCALSTGALLGFLAGTFSGGALLVSLSLVGDDPFSTLILSGSTILGTAFGVGSGFFGYRVWDSCNIHKVVTAWDLEQNNLNPEPILQLKHS